MKIKICFFEGTFSVYINGKWEVHKLTKAMWNLIDWLTENGWQVEVLPATVLLHLN